MQRWTTSAVDPNNGDAEHRDGDRRGLDRVGTRKAGVNVLPPTAKGLLKADFVASQVNQVPDSAQERQSPRVGLARRLRRDREPY